jgi:AcrR family transcriptional regulator
MAAREANKRGEGDLLRADLVRAATAMLLAPQGLAAPSLRAIARTCGVSPSAVYLHFDSQADLIGAVVAAQYAELAAALAKADKPRSAPRTRLHSLARAYVTWGIEHAGAYQLLFESADVLPAVVPGSTVGSELMAHVESLVRDHGVSRSEEAVRRTQRLWFSLHGLVSLHIHKPHADWSGSAQADAVALVDAALP